MMHKYLALLTFLAVVNILGGKENEGLQIETELPTFTKAPSGYPWQLEQKTVSISLTSITQSSILSQCSKLAEPDMAEEAEVPLQTVVIPQIIVQSNCVCPTLQPATCNSTQNAPHETSSLYASLESLFSKLLSTLVNEIPKVIEPLFNRFDCKSPHSEEKISQEVKIQTCVDSTLITLILREKHLNEEQPAGDILERFSTTLKKKCFS